jgi:hypothetical protein
MSQIQELCAAIDNITLETLDTFDMLMHVMKECAYVKKCKSNKKKDDTSLSSLVEKQLSQSECIKLGIALEKVLNIFVDSHLPHLKNIKVKNTKGRRETDCLFIDKHNNVIYGAEVKGNLNLDTEKSKATVTKCKDIIEELTQEHPQCEINMYLVSGRYLHTQNIPSNLRKRYEKMGRNLVGINDYLMILGYKGPFLTEKEYKEFINAMVVQMYDVI